MDGPNITMEEYIRLEEEKAQRHGRTFNWQTATFRKVKNYENEDDHPIDFETEFPAIVFDNTLQSSLNPRILFDESDDEDYVVIYDKNSFSYKIIYVNDLKTDSENDNDKVNMPSFPSHEPTVSCFDDLDFFKDFENEFPAIVCNDALTSKSNFLTEPALSPQHIDEFDLKDETPLYKCDEEEQNVICFNGLFPFNVIYPDDSKSDKDNDDNKIDIILSSEGIVINADDDAYAHRSNKLLETISSMSDSEDSTVTYTEISSPYEDLSDIGSPGAEGPIFQDPPSPDYVPGPEEPEQAPPSPIYVPFVPEPVYPEFLQEDDVLPAEEQPLPVAASPTTESPGYIPESNPKEGPEEDDEEDPEEDPANYPADRGDDRDDEEPSDDDDDDDDDAEEEEHLAPADPAAVAYSANQDPYLAYRVTARMSIRPQAPAPFLSEEVAERLLALPTPPPSPLSPYSSPLPQIPSPPLPIPSPPPNSPTYVEGSLGSRAAGIRQRDELPSPVHETEMPEICLPLCKSRWMLAIRYVPRAYHFGLRSWLSSPRSLSCRQQTVGDSSNETGRTRCG
ncbi:hypothetical protein Tco_0874747 [Tanacetum coccineum]|uniref:Uncharacterized protein n=1 Tax=Tanacetum coccineum TaxID=301880 RepID=A0ABQ5BMH9_9ASTR